MKQEKKHNKYRNTQWTIKNLFFLCVVKTFDNKCNEPAVLNWNLCFKKRLFSFFFLIQSSSLWYHTVSAGNVWLKCRERFDWDSSIETFHLILLVGNFQIETLAKAVIDRLMLSSSRQTWRNSSMETTPSPFRSIFCKTSKTIWSIKLL